MSKFFRIDGPYYRVMLNVWNLLVLNLLMLLTSLPIVTIGAAQTAGFKVTVQMISSSETKIASTYLRSFKRNLRQSTFVWTGLLILGAILSINWLYLARSAQLQSWVTGGVFIVTLMAINFFQYTFYYLSRYDDSLKVTMQNVLKVSLNYPFRSLLMLLVMILPVMLMLLSPVLILFGLYINLFIGLSFMHFMRTYLLLGVFNKLEQQVVYSKSNEL